MANVRRRAAGAGFGAALILLWLGGCASGSPGDAGRGGADAQVAVMPAAAAVPAMPQHPPAGSSSYLCTAKARYVRFADLGVPEPYRPVDVVATGAFDYVLMAPARLVRLERHGTTVKPEMIDGPAAQSWNALAIDPIDQSLWVGTEQQVLVHVSPSLHHEDVPLERLAGPGGFGRMVVARDAIYAAPVCGDDGVWRISRGGKLLGAAFPRPTGAGIPPATAGGTAGAAGAAAGGAAASGGGECSRVWLGSDAQGNVVLWNRRRRQLFRADEQGAWNQADPGVFGTVADALAPQAAERGPGGGLFQWQGRPVFLGTPPPAADAKGSPGTVLLVPEGGGVREVLEGCHGRPVLRVSATPARYAVLLADGVVLGDVASAPRLP